MSSQLGFLFEKNAAGFDHLIQASVIDADGKVIQQVYGMKFDIPLLIEHFCEKLREKMNIDLPSISEQDYQMLLHHDYPGNVRELENIIEHSVIFCRGENISVDDLPLQVNVSHEKMILDPHNLDSGYEAKLKNFENEMIAEALKQTNGNQSAAARVLNITERHLRSRLERLGLKKNK